VLTCAQERPAVAPASAILSLSHRDYEQALAAAVAAALGGRGAADPAAAAAAAADPAAASAAAGPETAASTALLQTLVIWAATPHGAAGCRRLVAQPQVKRDWDVGSGVLEGTLQNLCLQKGLNECLHYFNHVYIHCVVACST
jgi:hypothetical protein